MTSNPNQLVIDRYLTGLKTASLFYGLASLSALVLNLLFPFSENSESVTAFQLTLFVAAICHFGICFSSNVGNYRILLIALIATVLVQGAVMNKINASDMGQFVATSNQSVGGRVINLMFWAPTMFLIVSILFFRLKIFLFFVFVYTTVLAINLIPVLKTEGVYFAISKADIFFDNNAINRTTFMRSILTFSMVVGVGLAILW